MHLSLPKRFPLFILASFVCWSLQCLISALTQEAKVVTYLGSLLQSCCGEGGTLQRNITGMYGECLQCLGLTGFVPAHGVCAFPVYTSQALGCSAGELSEVGPGLHALPRSKLPRFRFSRVLHKGTDLVGPSFCALPRSEQLRRPGAWRAHCPRWSLCLIHLPGPSCLISWVHPKSAVSGVLCVSSGELISGCDPLGRCQPSWIPGRLG